jgi:hypothetical protein
MKQLTLILVSSFIFLLNAKAQDPNYDGPAKITVKAFWENAAKLEASITAGGSSMDGAKLSVLQNKINDTKRKDAAYNTSAMEAKVTTLFKGIEFLRGKAEADKKARDGKTFNSQEVAKILYSLFHISTQVDNGRLKTIKQEIEGYKKRTADVLTMDTSGNKSELRQHLVQLKNSFKSAEKDMYELDRRCREQTVAENAEVNYYELLYNQAYWDAAQKIYPNEENFKKAYSLATKLSEGLGSIDDVHKLASKSKQQKINDTKLPVAAMKDATLEKMFIDAFNKYHSEEFKGTATKAVLTSDDWSIRRHEITGIVTGRIRRAVIVYKGKEGKCYITANFFLLQEYVGSSFSSNAKSVYPIMGSQEMLCENVK